VSVCLDLHEPGQFGDGSSKLNPHNGDSHESVRAFDRSEAGGLGPRQW
jgi:hypothetical protein